MTARKVVRRFYQYGSALRLSRFLGIQAIWLTQFRLSRPCSTGIRGARSPLPLPRKRGDPSTSHRNVTVEAAARIDADRPCLTLAATAWTGVESVMIRRAGRSSPQRCWRSASPARRPPTDRGKLGSGRRGGQGQTGLFQRLGRLENVNAYIRWAGDRNESALRRHRRPCETRRHR